MTIRVSFRRPTPETSEPRGSDREVIQSSFLFLPKGGGVVEWLENPDTED